MKSILWISLCAPYDRVAHGGGKTHNFYLKQISASEKFHIHLITFCQMDEYKIAEEDLSEYGIEHTLIPWTHKVNIQNIKRKIQLVDAEKNPLNRYGGGTNLYYWDQIKQCIDNLNFEPTIIVLQWTEIVLFAEKIKKRFPTCKVVAIEEDVKFLANQRKIALVKNGFQRWIATKKYNQLKKKELKSLKNVDIIITYSEKDKKLLTQENLDNVITVAPYFEDFSECVYYGDKKDIIFYGAMSRQDNYDSAIWFIENVFNKIHDKDLRFVVVGSKPVDKLKSYANKRIIVTGFVDSVKPFFEHSLCLVAPLISGAGIKIKILEALSAGMPVITNNIGIEGISACDGVDYIHCESASEYRDTIRKVLDGKINLSKFSSNSSHFIQNNYDLYSDADRLLELLINL